MMRPFWEVERSTSSVVQNDGKYSFVKEKTTPWYIELSSFSNLMEKTEHYLKFPFDIMNTKEFRQHYFGTMSQ